MRKVHIEYDDFGEYVEVLEDGELLTADYLCAEEKQTV